MDIKHVLKEHAYQNIPLSYEEAYALGEYALQGCAGDTLAQIQSIAALSALHTRATYEWKKNGAQRYGHSHALPSTAAEQIAGVCAAVFEKDIAKSEFGFLCPKGVAVIMDNCGMGGDLTVTANVSTIAALIAASCGITMCKHGSPANADRGHHGSSDFIGLLGIDPMVSRETMERCVEKTHFGYIEALDTRYKHIHALTHKIAQLPHMNDIIGPITSPVRPSLMRKRVVGVNHLIPPAVVAEAYRILNDRGITNVSHAFFVRGFVDEERYRGMDEVSICQGGTQVVELVEGEVREYDITADTFGVPAVPTEAISPPHGMSKGDFSLKILTGEIAGAPLQMIFANAALLIHLSDPHMSLKQAFQLASDCFSKEKMAERVQMVRDALTKVAE